MTAADCQVKGAFRLVNEGIATNGLTMRASRCLDVECCKRHLRWNLMPGCLSTDDPRLPRHESACISKIAGLYRTRLFLVSTMSNAASVKSIRTASTENGMQIVSGKATSLDGRGRKLSVSESRHDGTLLFLLGYFRSCL